MTKSYLKSCGVVMVLGLCIANVQPARAVDDEADCFSANSIETPPLKKTIDDISRNLSSPQISSESIQRVMNDIDELVKVSSTQSGTRETRCRMRGIGVLDRKVQVDKERAKEQTILGQLAESLKNNPNGKQIFSLFGVALIARGASAQNVEDVYRASFGEKCMQTQGVEALKKLQDRDCKPAAHEPVLRQMLAALSVEQFRNLDRYQFSSQNGPVIPAAVIQPFGIPKYVDSLLNADQGFSLKYDSSVSTHPTVQGEVRYGLANTSDNIHGPNGGAGGQDPGGDTSRADVLYLYLDTNLNNTSSPTSADSNWDAFGLGFTRLFARNNVPFAWLVSGSKQQGGADSAVGYSKNKEADNWVSLNLKVGRLLNRKFPQTYAYNYIGGNGTAFVPVYSDRYGVHRVYASLALGAQAQHPTGNVLRSLQLDNGVFYQPQSNYAYSRLDLYAYLHPSDERPITTHLYWARFNHNIGIVEDAGVTYSDIKRGASLSLDRTHGIVDPLQEFGMVGFPKWTTTITLKVKSK